MIMGQKSVRQLISQIKETRLLEITGADAAASFDFRDEIAERPWMALFEIKSQRLTDSC